MAFVVAILGAESTGKTTLAHMLGVALREQGHSVGVVSEYLRTYCEQLGRTPRVDEQAHIAAEQSRLIAQAAEQFDVVVADTSALMIAVYSEWVFNDTGLYADALRTHATYHLTLLNALDLPWQADGHIRDGPHVREPVDALVRNALGRAGLGYAVVSGQGRARLESALAAVQHALAAPARAEEAGSAPRWQWVCDRCGDADCERHLLPRAGREAG